MLYGGDVAKNDTTHFYDLVTIGLTFRCVEMNRLRPSALHAETSSWEFGDARMHT
jgi:hypothetical protein